MSLEKYKNADNRYTKEGVNVAEDAEKEKERIRRVDKERKRLKKIIKDLREETTKGSVGLIDTLAFLRVQMQDLEAHIVKFGTKEEYQNGDNQFGFKESTEFKVYNAFLQRYVQFNNQFISMLPPETREKVTDGFDEALANKPK